MSTITFIIITLCYSIGSSYALVRTVGRGDAESMIIEPPRHWQPGDTVRITTRMETVDGKATIVQDTTIGRWKR